MFQNRGGRASSGPPGRGGGGRGGRGGAKPGASGPSRGGGRGGSASRGSRGGSSSGGGRRGSFSGAAARRSPSRGGKPGGGPSRGGKGGRGGRGGKGKPSGEKAFVQTADGSTAKITGTNMAPLKNARQFGNSASGPPPPPPSLAPGKRRRDSDAPTPQKRKKSKTEDFSVKPLKDERLKGFQKGKAPVVRANRNGDKNGGRETRGFDQTAIFEKSKSHKSIKPSFPAPKVLNVSETSTRAVYVLNMGPEITEDHIREWIIDYAATKKTITSTTKLVAGIFDKAKTDKSSSEDEADKVSTELTETSTDNVGQQHATPPEALKPSETAIEKEADKSDSTKEDSRTQDLSDESDDVMSDNDDGEAKGDKESNPEELDPEALKLKELKRQKRSERRKEKKQKARYVQNKLNVKSQQLLDHIRNIIFDTQESNGKSRGNVYVEFSTPISAVLFRMVIERLNKANREKGLSTKFVTKFAKVSKSPFVLLKADLKIESIEVLEDSVAKAKDQQGISVPPTHPQLPPHAGQSLPPHAGQRDTSEHPAKMTAPPNTRGASNSVPPSRNGSNIPPHNIRGQTPVQYPPYSTSTPLSESHQSGGPKPPQQPTQKINVPPQLSFRRPSQQLTPKQTAAVPNQRPDLPPSASPRQIPPQAQGRPLSSGSGSPNPFRQGPHPQSQPPMQVPPGRQHTRGPGGPAFKQGPPQGPPLRAFGAHPGQAPPVSQPPQQEVYQQFQPPSGLSRRPPPSGPPLHQKGPANHSPLQQQASPPQNQQQQYQYPQGVPVRGGPPGPSPYGYMSAQARGPPGPPGPPGPQQYGKAPPNGAFPQGGAPGPQQAGPGPSYQYPPQYGQGPPQGFRQGPPGPPGPNGPPGQQGRPAGPYQQQQAPFAPQNRFPPQGQYPPQGQRPPTGPPY